MKILLMFIFMIGLAYPQSWLLVGGGNYAITTSISGLGSLDVNPDQAKYKEGTSIILTATADVDTGWAFDSWSGDITGSVNPYTISKIKQDYTLTSTFLYQYGDIFYTSEGDVFKTINDKAIKLP